MGSFNSAVGFLPLPWDNFSNRALPPKQLILEMYLFRVKQSHRVFVADVAMQLCPTRQSSNGSI